MKYFLPDWDDRVDPGYDFITDRPTYERDTYRDDIYAHQVFDPEPCYDGILVSRSAMAKTGLKRELVERRGFRTFFRLPQHMEIMGDCGAFGYIDEPTPAYETAEVLDYYARLGVDYGISVDHIIVPAYPSQRLARYELTIENAIEFLRLHRRQGAAFTPVGAVQGWDAASYAESAARLVHEGYTMLAIGGLVRTNTKSIREILTTVVATVGRRVRLHVLGIAREGLVGDLVNLGIFSCDSASPMRTAWASANRNYLMPRGSYTAIRVPFSEPVKGLGADNVVSRGGTASLAELGRYERTALEALRSFGAREGGLQETLDAVAAYDEHLTRKGNDLPRERRLQSYRQTLQDRPWERCGCAVCVSIGIDVVVFRGSNRNRRRGFHNTLTFYRGLLGERRMTRQALTSLGGEGLRGSHEQDGSSTIALP